MAGHGVDPEGAATHCATNAAQIERILEALGHHEYKLRVEGNDLVVETAYAEGPLGVVGNSGNVGNRWGGNGYGGASGFKVKMEGPAAGGAC